MKQMKRILILTILFLMVLNITVFGMETKVKEYQNTIKVDDTIEFKLEFDKKIITSDFELIYNDSVLEFISSSDSKVETNIVKRGNLICVYVDEMGVGTDNIGLIFKALAPIDSTAIQVTDINAYSVDEDKAYSSDELNIKNLKMEFKIINKSDSGDSGNEDDPNSIGGNNPNSYNSGKLPNTGINMQYVYLLISIVVFIIVLINFITFIKNGSSFKKTFLILFALIIAGTSLTQAASSIYIKAYKKIKNFDNIIVIMPDIENRFITASDFLDIIPLSGNVKNKDNTKLENEALITNGSTLELDDGRNYKVLLYGDVNADGKINSNDIALIVYNNLNRITLEGEFKKAANLSNKNDSEDKTIDSKDIERFKLYILKKLDGTLVEELPTELSDEDPGQETENIRVTGLTLTPDTVQIYVGKTTTLTATITPENAKNKKIIWTSNNTTDVTVDQSGLVTGINPGIATITATTEDGGFSKSCTVTVLANEPDPTIHVTGITLNRKNIEVYTGETSTLVATVLPENATNKNITWTSNNTTNATVDQTGVVRGINPGVATITVTTEDGNFSESCTVTVIEKAPTISVTGVTLDKETAEVFVGENTSLVATVLPNNATNKRVTWTSGNTAIATVDSSGTITGISTGTTTITVTTEDGGFTKTCNLTVSIKDVTVPVTSIALNKERDEIFEGETSTLEATVLPANATNKNVIWESNNPSVARVNETGIVTGISAGTAIITVKTEDGTCSKTCTITVKRTVRVTGITLNIDNTGVSIGDNIALIASVTPADATNKNVIWESSDPSVASVNSAGTVTGVSEGTAIITATSEDGGFSKTCNIIVENNYVRVTGLRLYTDTATLALGEKNLLLDTVLPENASNNAVICTSSNPDIVRVDQSGNIMGIGVGTATVTITTVEGHYSQSCIVSVEDTGIRITSITLNATSINLTPGNTFNLIATITPSTVTNGAILWTSSDLNVAVVTDDGLVTGVRGGTATITASSFDGTVTATCQVTVTDSAPVVTITNANLDEDSVIKAGDTTYYNIKITDNNISTNSVDKNKVKILTNGDGYSDLLNSYCEATVYEPTKTDDGIIVPVKVSTTNSINGVGHLNIIVEEGFITDSNGNKNTEVIKNDYIASLNTTTTEDSITASVGVANSFYIKGYTFYLDGSPMSDGTILLGDEQIRTTNEYVYSNLSLNSTHNIKVKVEYYIGKSNDETLSGFIELNNITLSTNAGIAVHFIDSCDDPGDTIEGDGGILRAADTIFMKTAGIDGKSVLIDTGRFGDAHKDGAVAIDKYVNEKNIVTKSGSYIDIDYLIITHRDGDHIGGFSKLVGFTYNSDGSYSISNELTNKYRFKEIIFGIDEKETYDKVVNGTATGTAKIATIFRFIVDSHNADPEYWNVKFATAGNSFTVGNSVLNIFNPYPRSDIPAKFLEGLTGDGIRQGAYNLNDNTSGTLSSTAQTEHTSQNNSSVVVKLLCGDRKFLFMGDAEFMVEEMLTGTVYNEITTGSNNTTFTQATNKVTNGRTYGYDDGLLIRTSNGYTNDDTYIIGTNLNLVKDIMVAEGCTKQAVETKYRLSRLTPKDVTTQMLKKGHHGVNNTTSESFLLATKTNKIIITGVIGRYETSLIKCVDNSADFRIRAYYANPNSGASVKAKAGFEKAQNNNKGTVAIGGSTSRYGLQQDLHQDDDYYHANWFYSVFTPCSSKYAVKSSSQTASTLGHYYNEIEYNTSKTNNRYKDGIMISTTDGKNWGNFEFISNYIHNTYYFDSNLCSTERIN